MNKAKQSIEYPLADSKIILRLPETVQIGLCKFFTEGMPKARWLMPDGDPKREWTLLFGGKTWVAAREYVLTYVHPKSNIVKPGDVNVVLNAAEESVFAVARGAGRIDALTLVRCEVCDALTAKIPKSVAREDAITYAELMSHFMVVTDLIKKDDQNLAYAKAGWNVLRKGYVPFGDVNGELLVYAKKPHTERQEAPLMRH
jgi:hypothetical protein